MKGKQINFFCIDDDMPEIIGILKSDNFLLAIENMETEKVSATDNFERFLQPMNNDRLFLIPQDYYNKTEILRRIRYNNVFFVETDIFHVLHFERGKVDTVNKKISRSRFYYPFNTWIGETLYVKDEKHIKEIENLFKIIKKHLIPFEVNGIKQFFFKKAYDLIKEGGSEFALQAL